MSKKEPLYPHIPKGKNVLPKWSEVVFSAADWDQISNGIDKLLDLEARQPGKIITSEEFALLESLLTKVTGKTTTSRFVSRR